MIRKQIAKLEKKAHASTMMHKSQPATFASAKTRPLRVKIVLGGGTVEMTAPIKITRITQQSVAVPKNILLGPPSNDELDTDLVLYCYREV